MTSKRKDAVALFEAISKTRPKLAEGSMTVPSWMTRTPQAPELPASSTSPAPAAPAPAPQVTVAPVPPPSRLGEVQERAAQFAGRLRPGWGAEPTFSTYGGRVRVSLNYLSAGVAAAGLVVVLLATFLIGRVTAPRQVAATETPQGVPVKPDVLNTAGQGQQTGTPPAPSELVKGKFYLVVQDLRGNTEAMKDEALKIADFCKGNGKPAKVIIYGNRTYMVWSTVPFNSQNDAAAKAHAQEIEELGKKYRAQGGKYDFMQRKSRTGPLDPMVIKQP